MNNGWKENINQVLEKDYQLIWQTGKLDYKNILEETKDIHSRNIQIVEFIKNMEMAYSAADVIVSRAGAIAISELAIAKKPVLLVPFPLQQKIIKPKRSDFGDKNAAKMVKDTEMKEKFWNTDQKFAKTNHLRKKWLKI